MANVAVNNLVTKACLDAEIAALNLGTTEVGDGTTVVGAGTPADPFKAGDLVENADGSYTYTKADGSTIVIPADCCPTLVANPDGSYTYTHGDGSTVTIPAPAVGGVPEVGDGTTVVGAGTPADPFVAGALTKNDDTSLTWTNASGVATPIDLCQTTAEFDPADCTRINIRCGGNTVSTLQLPLPERRTAEFYQSPQETQVGAVPSAAAVWNQWLTPATVTFTLSRPRRVRIGHKVNINWGSPAVASIQEGYQLIFTTLFVNGVRACNATTRYEQVIGLDSMPQNYGGDTIAAETFIDLPAGTHVLESRYWWNIAADPVIVLQPSGNHVFAEWIAYDCEGGEQGTTAPGCAPMASETW